MISVETALERLFDLVTPLPTETVPLRAAHGRVLAKPVQARRDQPPFAASSMDGYAIRESDYQQGAKLHIIGEAAAGAGFDGQVAAGEAVRIFTGAPLPAGAERVVIQEDVIRFDGKISLSQCNESKPYIRPAGADFKAGTQVSAPRRLTPEAVALLASMNIAEVPVTRKPKVAVISTGSELVMPGETPGPDQIIASNTFGLTAMLEQAGAEVQMLPIARDTLPSLHQAFRLAGEADLIVTIGGASVGDHDLVGQVSAELGMDRAFYKVAMRPGKPLMAGKLGNAAMIGLPGNPVSAMVCGVVFVLPVLRKMLGLGAQPAQTQRAPLAAPLPANGPRAHYMRALLQDGTLHAFDRQDSALLTVLAEANALILRPPHDPARNADDLLSYIAL